MTWPGRTAAMPGAAAMNLASPQSDRPIASAQTALLLLLAACGGGSTTGNGSTPTTNPATPTVTPPNDLLVPGTLTVGSDPTYPPQEYIDTTNNKPAGCDIDVSTAIAQRMGLQVHVVTTSFDTIIDSLVAKRFDVVISAVSVTPAARTSAPAPARSRRWRISQMPATERTSMRKSL